MSGFSSAYSGIRTRPTCYYPLPIPPLRINREIIAQLADIIPHLADYICIVEVFDNLADEAGDFVHLMDAHAASGHRRRADADT